MSTKKGIITIIIGIEAVILVAVIVFLFYINSDTVRINRQLELAQRYLLEEDYEQAIAAYEIVIEIDPKNADAYLGLAEAYVSLNELGNAVKTLEQAAMQTDSEEILEMLQIHIAEIEQRQLAAQRAAEATTAIAQNQTDDVVAKAIQPVESEDTSVSETEFRAASSEAEPEAFPLQGELGNAAVAETEVSQNPSATDAVVRTEREDHSDGSYSISYYDSNGNQIKYEWYNGNGTLNWCGISYYDSNGNWIKYEYYVGDTLAGYSIYSYDSNGNMIKDESYYYNKDGTLNRYDISYYDSNGNKIKEECYYGNGTLEEVKSYDSNGNLIK